MFITLKPLKTLYSDGESWSRKGKAHPTKIASDFSSVTLAAYYSGGPSHRIGGSVPSAWTLLSNSHMHCVLAAFAVSLIPAALLDSHSNRSMPYAEPSQRTQAHIVLIVQNLRATKKPHLAVIINSSHLVRLCSKIEHVQYNQCRGICLCCSNLQACATRLLMTRIVNNLHSHYQKKRAYTRMYKLFFFS